MSARKGGAYSRESEVSKMNLKGIYGKESVPTTARRPATATNKRKEREAETGTSSTRTLPVSSQYTVGFKNGGIKTPRDLTHFRQLIAHEPIQKQVKSVLLNLEETIARINTEQYESVESDEKYGIITQLIEAYNFAWNEGCMQLKGISSDHAKLFLKMKGFYISLFDKYPNLVDSFQEEMNVLKKSIVEKDQEIKLLRAELKEQNERNEAEKKFICGIQNELNNEKERKKYYKSELNSQVLEVETYKTLIIDLRCQLQRAKEELERFQIKDKAIFKIEDVEKTDIGTLAKPIEKAPIQNESVVVARSRSTHMLQRVDSVDRILSVVPIEEIDMKFGNFRSSVFSLINNTDIDKTIEMPKIENNGDYKRFDWAWPKICLIFINAKSFEEPSNPFTSFPQIVFSYFSNVYKTSFLANKMVSSLVQTVDLIKDQSFVVQLFINFFENTYDFTLFRFFNSMIEFSIMYSTPDIADLMATEMITPQESVVTISKKNAISVHQTIFPFWDTPPEIASSTSELDYWVFLDYMIQEYIKARKHILAFVKHGLLLSGCTDFLHITFKNFTQFIAIAFPEIHQDKLKIQWKELKTRHQALGKPSGDFIDNESILYYAVSKDNLLISIMRTNTVKLFTQIYFDWNASMLELLDFIMKRITHYIPSLKSVITNQAEELNQAAYQIRRALFMANLSEAIAIYRKMLHTIDFLTVDNFSNIIVTNQSSASEIQKLIDHMITRENVVGIIQGKS